MSPTQRLRDLAVSDSGFLFDPFSGQTFSVNATGRFLLDLLKGGAEPDSGELADGLRRAFETGPGDDPGRDAREFIHLLREAGLWAASAS